MRALTILSILFASSPTIAVTFQRHLAITVPERVIESDAAAGSSGTPFGSPVKTFLLGALVTFVAMSILIVRYARRAGIALFDFLAIGWIGSRGINAVAKHRQQQSDDAEKR